MTLPHSAAIACLALLSALVATPARAETWATCTGTISSVPAVIDTPGVWCMDRNLTTAMASGIAINIRKNFVTIDCNGFLLGNLAAGLTTAAIGIQASERRNITLRNCHTRGFAAGINITGNITAPINSFGHLVEDNLIEASTVQGLVVKGLDSTIRRNRLVDIGLNPTLSVAGIAAIGTVDVVDNLVDGVEVPSTSANSVWGIYSQPTDGTLIARNEVRGVVPGVSFGYGIFVVGASGARSSIRENVIVRAATSTLWIRCSPGYTAAVKENVSMGWTSGSSNCYSFDEIEGS